MTEPAPPPIPVFQPHIGVDTVKAVVDALHAGWLGMGAITQTFEQGIARYLELRDRHVLATNTGTSALHLGLLAAGVGPGDEVITPAFNFVADHQAIVATGATPVLCDVEDATLGIDADKIAALVGPRTRAIVPLHFGGVPGRVKELYAAAERHHVRVVEAADRARGPLLISHFAAAAAWGIDVLGAWPDTVDVTVPRTSGGRSSGVFRRSISAIASSTTSIRRQSRETTPGSSFGSSSCTSVPLLRGADPSPSSRDSSSVIRQPSIGPAWHSLFPAQSLPSRLTFRVLRLTGYSAATNCFRPI